MLLFLLPFQDQPSHNIQRRPTMGESGQDPLDDVQEMMEIPKLEATKQNLDYLNSDLEKDLQRLDKANLVLLRKIQEKEETVQSLEREVFLSVGKAREREELIHILSEKEEALRGLEVETAKLEKKKEMLSRNVVEVQKEISRRFKNVGLDKETLKQMLAELKVESDYQSVYQLCEDQAHYIKKYQEILRQMEKEKEVLLLEKEVFKAQNDSSQIVKPGSILVETIQSNMEKTIIKKQKRIFWYRHFKYLVFMVMIFIRLLGYMLFYLQYINPDLLVDALPMVMSRDTLKRLRDVLFPFLTLEVEEVLPH
ncbi:transmembrane and coiled-coil domain-containing protein 5B-like isoform X2 [Vicugna pacos]|uniref:Transmembrane and coiled-coil domain-containing protein 5B-like isoform X2 n=1 Tax=Vicugna pacos TaxID=30538 RepID=A0ABM5DD75_VICPA